MSQSQIKFSTYCITFYVMSLLIGPESSGWMNAEQYQSAVYDSVNYPNSNGIGLVRVGAFIFNGGLAMLVGLSFLGMIAAILLWCLSLGLILEKYGESKAVIYVVVSFIVVVLVASVITTYNKCGNLWMC